MYFLTTYLQLFNIFLNLLTYFMKQKEEKEGITLPGERSLHNATIPQINGNQNDQKEIGPQISQHFQTYKQKLKEFVEPAFLRVKKKMQQKGEIRQKNNFIQKLQRIVIKKQNDSITFSCSFGKFELRISLLKLHIPEDTFDLPTYSSGTFGKIFQFFFEGDHIIVKSQKIKNNDPLQFNNTLNNILQELIFYMIGSKFNFGPYLKPIFGYHIIYFKNSFWFAMEFCETEFSQEKKKTLKSDLLENLLIMHNFGIVHRDIKEDNIAWSPHFQKWVFIDFGFSKFVKESFGKKSLTGYAGTYQYMSKQMRKLYHLKQRGMVDLYYNDLYGLEKTFENIERTFVRKDSIIFFKEKLEDKNYFSLIFKILRFKFEIYQKNTKKLEKFLEQEEEIRFILVQLIKKKVIQGKGQNFLNQIDIQDLSQILKKYQKVHKTKKQTVKRIQKIILSENNQITEWNQLIFTFDIIEDLPCYIKKMWKTKYFMECLFYFIDDANFSDDAEMQEKAEKIIHVICELFIEGSEKKNKYWKFRHVLYELVDFFIEEKNQIFLQQIKIYFKIFRESKEIREKIQNKIQNVQKYFYNFSPFVQKLLALIEKKSKCSEYLKLHQELEKVDYCQNESLGKIRKVILETVNFFATAQRQEKEILSELDSFLEKYKNQSKKQSVQNYFLEKRIREVESDNFYSKREEKELNCSRLNIRLFKIMFLKAELYSLFSKRQYIKIKHYYQSIPFLRRMPIFQTCFYYVQENNTKQASEVFEQIIEIYKFNIQRDFEPLALLCVILRGEIGQYVEKFIQYFETYSLKNLEVQNIVVYWDFIIHLTILSQTENHHKKIKEFLFEIISFYKKTEFVDFTTEFFFSLMTTHFEFIASSEKKAISKLIGLTQSRKKWGKKEIQNYFQLVKYYLKEGKSPSTHFSIEQMCLSEYKLLENRKFLKDQFFLQFVIQALCRKNKIKQVFNLFNQMADKFEIDIRSSHLEKSVVKNLFQHNRLEKIVNYVIQNICVKPLSEIRNNKYISALILMVYQKIEEELEPEHRKRLLILSSVSIDKCPFALRVNLKNYLITRSKEVKTDKTRRKKLIMLKRREYGRKKINGFEELAVKRMRKWTRVQKQRIGSLIMQKIGRIRYNLQKKETLTEKTWFMEYN